MTERERQRRLRIQNRLEELAAKYGPLEQGPTPEWLESIEGWYAYHARMRAEAPARPVSPPVQAPPPKRAQEPSRARPSDW